MQLSNTKPKKKDDHATLLATRTFGNVKIQLAPIRISLKKSAYERKRIRSKYKRKPHPTSTLHTQTQDHDEKSSKSKVDKIDIKRNILDTIKSKVTHRISRQLEIASRLPKSIKSQLSKADYLARTNLILLILVPILVVLSIYMSGLLGLGHLENQYGIIVQYDSHESETIRAQDSISRTFLIKNNNKKPVILNFIVKNWDPPEAQHRIEILWDYDESPIPPGETCKIIMIIKNLSNQEIYDYSFYIDFTSQHA